MRRIGERRLAGQAGMGNILSEDIENRVSVGGGLHIGNIECFELLDIFQHAAELRLKSCGFFVGEFDAGQAGDISDIKVGTAHARVFVEVRSRFVQKFDVMLAESLAVFLLSGVRCVGETRFDREVSDGLLRPNR